MAALTGPRVITDRLGDASVVPMLSYKLKAGAKIHAGGLVQIDSTGFAIAGGVGTGRICVGVAQVSVDNTLGANGAVSVAVRRGAFKLGNSTGGDLIGQADLNKTVFVADDQTVAKTDATGTRSAAGKVLQIEADGVFVEILG